MPELPDLEVFSENLKRKIAGKKITDAFCFNSLRINIDNNTLSNRLAGSEISDILRIGKELYFHLANEAVFSVHLMLHGRLDICPSSYVSGVRNKIMSIGFEDAHSLVISDFQGLCKITFDPLITDIPDALGDDFTLDYFISAVKRNQRKNVKAFLTDQNIVKGIGNAYVDEILWEVGISPLSTVGKIPDEKITELFDAISFVLNDAIINIKKLRPHIISGEERSFLKVHNSKKTHTDDGEKIIVDKIASKITYYTESQKLFR